MPVLTISARALGKRKALVPDWQVPWPPQEQPGGEPLTLRQLITRLVLHGSGTAFRDENIGLLPH